MEMRRWPSAASHSPDPLALGQVAFAGFLGSTRNGRGLQFHVTESNPCTPIDHPDRTDSK
jgi:hypothetical protein